MSEDPPILIIVVHIFLTIYIFSELGIFAGLLYMFLGFPISDLLGSLIGMLIGLLLMLLSKIAYILRI